MTPTNRHYGRLSERRSGISIASGSTATLIALVIVIAFHPSPQGTGIAGRDDVNVSNLVVVTEDNASGAVNSGCDAISAHDIESGQVVDRGVKHVSPGRLAVMPDLSLLVANASNSCGYRTVDDVETNPGCEAWLTVRQPQEKDLSLVRDRLFAQGDIVPKGGVLFNSAGDLIVATGTGETDTARMLNPAGPPYGIARLDMPDNIDRVNALGDPLGWRETSSVVGEILPSLANDELYLVALDGLIYTINEISLADTRSPISYPTAQAPRNAGSNTLPPIEGFHASYSMLHRTIAINGMRRSDITIVNVDSGRVASHTIDAGEGFVGGVSYNNAWINKGLLAVHVVDRVMVLSQSDDLIMSIVDEFPIRPPFSSYASLSRTSAGPRLSISWSADGRRVIAASNQGTAEFVVLEVNPVSQSLSEHGVITACHLGKNWANDVWTANGLITPDPSPTDVITPTATTSPTASPSVTALPTATPTSSATVTSPATPSRTVVPRPAYLPVALTESCDPTQVRIDVALVIDASSSMREPASPGSATTKLDAALQAVGSFLDLLALGAGDQAAIVSFSSDAWLHVGLTADRAALDSALAEVEPGQQTRLDRGIELGTAALLDDATRDPGNEPVLIVLTDGRANPVPVEVAVERADDAKVEGITIFTIGLGEDLEVEALRSIASEPAFYLHAPTAGELAGVYAEVARSIPCPASAYWGGR